jgi:hypothetical protein
VAVQIMWSSRRGSRSVEVEALKATARERLAAAEGELDLGMEVSAPACPLPITWPRWA